MKKGGIYELRITDLAFGGKGIGQVTVNNEQLAIGSAFVIFVDGALPGQVVRARIVKKKRRYAEAKLVEVLKRSGHEVETGYQDVPGAPWARLPVEKQLDFKKKQVFDLFQKFAGVNLMPVFDEAILSPEAWNYRNKMEFSFGPTSERQITNNKSQITRGEWEHSGFGLGSKQRGQFHLVENLETPSGLFDEDFERFVPVFRNWCEATGLPVFNQRTNEGFWRHLVVRRSVAEDRFLINIVTTSAGRDALQCVSTEMVQIFLDHLGDRVAGVFWSVNDQIGDTAQNFTGRTLLHGEEKLMEGIGDLEFEISLDSFFQTNPGAAEKLYGKVVEYVGLDSKIPPNPPLTRGGPLVLDLFCGTGTIGQIIAHKNKGTQVIGVEIVESAVNDARANAKRNGIANVEFVCADVRKWLKEMPDQVRNEVGCVILDPPRAGMSPKSLERTLALHAPNLVYVSCNPATMARDTAVIREAGYQLQQFSIVDQFPHTSHVECVGRFTLFNA